MITYDVRQVEVHAKAADEHASRAQYHKDRQKAELEAYKKAQVFERKARGNKDIKYLHKYFKVIEVVPYVLGISVELGTVGRERREMIKQVFSDIGMKGTCTLDNADYEYYSYSKDDVCYFVRYEKEPEV